MKFPAQLSEVFDFGKWEGKTVEQVIDTEPTYLNWCEENLDAFILAAGAKRYLQEALEEWDEDNSFWSGSYQTHGE